MTRLFGTDGIRGVANVDLRPSLAFALGRATAHQVVGPGGALVVGQDTRRSGDMFVAAITAGATSMGADVHPVGVVPTPALAFLAADPEFAAGIMVSASHNPAEDNGLKVLDRRGLKLDDDVEDELEAPSCGPTSCRRCRRTRSGGRSRRRSCSRGTWPTAAGSRAVDAGGLHVVLDTANGAAFRVAPEILRATGARVTVIHDDPDGDNINATAGRRRRPRWPSGPGAGADVGFALDGDADRCVAVDGEGKLVDGDQVLGILALERLARGVLDQGQPRRLRAVQRRAPARGRGRRRPDRPDPRRRQAHPRGDAGVGRGPGRREERPRDHPRAHDLRRRDRDGDRAAAGDDRRAGRDRGAAAVVPLLPQQQRAIRVRHRDQWEDDDVLGRPSPTRSGGWRRTAGCSCVPRAPSPCCGSWSRAATRRWWPSWPTRSRRSQGSDYTSQPRRWPRIASPRRTPQAHVRHRRLYRPA